MAHFGANRGQAQGLVMVDLKPVQPAEGLSLSRWSRLKRSGGEATVAVAPAVAPASLAVEAADAAELDLPQLSSISLIEDFTPFMQAKVPQVLRQQALKALFKEPHFNVMDGLDTYIDDYTVFEPITPEVMATLSSWKTIMNPTQQVVTPGGYAVDVESEEGKAVLAARVEALRLDAPSDDASAPLPPGGGGAGGEGEGAASAAIGAVREPSPLPQGERELEAASASDAFAVFTPTQHPRHNKRVSDFAYIDVADTPPLATETPE